MSYLLRRLIQERPQPKMASYTPTALRKSLSSYQITTLRGDRYHQVMGSTVIDTSIKNQNHDVKTRYRTFVLKSQQLPAPRAFLERDEYTFVKQVNDLLIKITFRQHNHNTRVEQELQLCNPEPEQRHQPLCTKTWK